MGIPERTGSRNPASWELNRRRELCPQLWQKEHHGEAKLQHKTRESSKSSPKPWMQSHVNEIYATITNSQLKPRETDAAASWNN